MKKKFGQNFLINFDIISKIIIHAKINKHSDVLEIGPGDGALSKEIVKKKPSKYIAVEIDYLLKNKIEKIFNNTNYKLIFEDALKFDEQFFFKNKIILISNLPYNISIPLLIKWTYLTSSYSWCSRMILMFQKEVADRIISNENSKKFGRISILVSAFFKITKLFDVPKENFFPVPKVNSSVLLFEPLQKKKITSENLKALELLSHELFKNRRKKIKNKLKKLFNDSEIKSNNLEKLYDLRAENLNKSIFYNLAKILSKSILCKTV